MTEHDEGQGRLTGLTDRNSSFDVEYSILFTILLRQIRSGFPPVPKFSAAVNYIRSIDGRSIPAGEYLLHRNKGTNRVSNLGFSWHVLSWPPV